MGLTLSDIYYNELYQWLADQWFPGRGVITNNPALYKEVAEALKLHPNVPEAELFALIKRIRGGQAEVEWSVYKSPAAWQKELGISPTTWRRYVKKKLLVVDPKTGNRKNRRISLDSLKAFLGE